MKIVKSFESENYHTQETGKLKSSHLQGLQQHLQPYECYYLLEKYLSNLYFIIGL